MEQCWAADPEQRPSFTSLIEKFEAIRQIYDIWQSNMNFPLDQMCWAQFWKSTFLCDQFASMVTIYYRVANEGMLWKPGFSTF